MPKAPCPSFFLDSFTHSVTQEISRTIDKLFRISVPPEDLVSCLNPPPQPDWGHWALSCFFLSPLVKKKPEKIAGQLAQAINAAGTEKADTALFKKASANKAYLNLFFHDHFLHEKLLKAFQSGALFQVPAKKQKGDWLIEYSQPNTHKELHIGHMRNLCFGQALVTLLKKRGFQVRTCTFPGDTGTHIAKCLWYLEYHHQSPFPEVNKGQWLGGIYAKACKKFEESIKDPKQASEIQQQVTDILQQLQKKEGPFYILWQKTRMWSAGLMKDIYQWTGVEFDKWYWESEVDAPSVAWVKKLYKEGHLELSKSAIGLNLGKKLGFCLLLKSDGNGLYATKDLYLAWKKFQDYQLEKNIYIVDQRQQLHFQQFLAVLNKIGFSDIAQKSRHLKYNFVELPEGLMRSREGTVIPIMTLIQEMVEYVKKQFLQKYEGEWSPEKIHKTAHDIAKGAVKYGMNEQDINKKIIFNMKEWLKWDGRSGPYIQYAFARSCSLLKKLNKSYPLSASRMKITAPEEEALIVHLSWFSLTMETCAWQMKTSPICHYLFELSKKFSQFYQNCPIGSLKDEKQKLFRLFLVQIVNVVLKEGLLYLSIPAPDQM